MNEIISPQNDDSRRLGLRERKKIMAQATIEEVALRLFQQRGYEQTSIQDIADAVMMSSRTFFRYFASKEELLFAPTQAILAEGVRYLQRIPMIEAEEPSYALTDTLVYLAGLYQQQKARFLLRYRIAMVSPPLASVTLFSFAGTEPAFCQALLDRLGTDENQEYIRFLVAVYMAAFRAALTVWLEHETNDDLTPLLREHLAYFSTLARENG